MIRVRRGLIAVLAVLVGLSGFGTSLAAAGLPGEIGAPGQPPTSAAYDDPPPLADVAEVPGTPAATGPAPSGALSSAFSHDDRADFARPPPADLDFLSYDSRTNPAEPADDLGRGLSAFLGSVADLVAPRMTSGLADDVLGLGDDALGGLTASQRSSVRSLQTNIAEHEAKLTAYINNPDAYDNLGYLANAPSDAVRQSIIQGRVRHLEGEISTFADQIRKLTGGG